MKPVSFRPDLSDLQAQQFLGHLQVVDFIRTLFSGPLEHGGLPTKPRRKSDKFLELLKTASYP
jgi:hypothetical protein